MVQNIGLNKEEPPDPSLRRFLFDKCTWLILSLTVIVGISLTTTSRPPSIQPNGPIAVGSVVLMILFASLSIATSQKYGELFDLAFLFSTSCFSLSLYLSEGIPITHDHLYNQFPAMAAVKSLAAQGTFMPRWVHGIWCGVPLGRFYSPVFFFLSAILPWLNPVETIRTLYIGFYFIAAVTMYYTSRRVLGDKRAALVAAFCYSLFGYHLLNSNVRGDTVELLAYAWIPLVFYTTLSLMTAETRRDRTMLLVASALLLSLTILTHFLIGFLVLVWIICFLVWLLILHPETRKKKGNLLYASLSIPLGLGLSAWFLVPAILEKDFFRVSTLNQDYYMITNHFMELSQFFVRRTWSKWWLTSPTWPIYLGNGIFVIALFSLIYIIKESDRSRKALYFFMLTTTLVTILFSSTICRPIGQFLLESSNPFLNLPTYLQFPWRTLEICGYSTSMLTGYTVHKLFQSSYLLRRGFMANKRLTETVVVLTIFLVIIVDMWPYTGAVAYSVPYADQDLSSTINWLSDQPGIFRVYFSGDDLENLYWYASASGYYIMTFPRGGAYNEWNPIRIYNFMERANEELDRGRRLSISGYFSVRYIVADQSEIGGWLETGTVQFTRRFGRLVVFENILFKPYAEVNLDNRDRSSPVVESTISVTLFEEERMILDVFVHREGSFFLTLKESYYSPWRAWVDDVEVTVESTKRGFILVPITGGEHKVELRFGRSIPEVAGLFVSAVSVIAISVVLLCLFSRSTILCFRMRNLRERAK